MDSNWPLHIPRLPSELWLYIFEFLSEKQRSIVASLDRRFQRYCRIELQDKNLVRQKKKNL
jgi:hypothetical protein